jgi:selenocysteine-specific elongation factor
MPQTREHFEICRLLGLRAGLLVLTKCDLADVETQKVAELELRELVQGSFLEAAPVLRVSARTGEGLPELRQALLELALRIAARPAGGVLRLPIDRVFSMRGFGTVVTGTLVAGTLAVGEELLALPAGRSLRVRGLQVHGQAAPSVGAGNRTAVNLAGVETADLARGDVLVRPGTLRATSMLDVEITLLRDARPLRDQARVRVHLASAERLARVRLLGAPELQRGSSGLAQLRLEAPSVAGRGDRLILRSYSPAATIGGARVLDPLPGKRRRGDAVATPAGLADATPAAAALRLVAAAGVRGVELTELAARVTAPLEELRKEVGGPDLVVLGKEPGHALAAEAVESLAREVLERLAADHKQSPLKAAVPKEELRRQAFGFAPDGTMEHVLLRLAERGAVRLSADAVALAGHSVSLSSDESRVHDALLAAAVAAGLAGVEPAESAAKLAAEPKLVERVARLLAQEGRLVRVGEGRLVHAEHLHRLKEELRARWPPGTRLDVGGFKEMTGLTRKFVIPLLEYLDRERVTRRAGNERLVLAAQ